MGGAGVAQRLRAAEPPVPARGGEIFRVKFVIEYPGGAVYFLPEALRDRYADGTAVSFTLRDANHVATLEAVAPASRLVRVPEAVKPVYPQLSQKECAIAVLRMVYEAETWERISRKAVKDLFVKLRAYDPVLGADVTAIPRAINTLLAEYREQNWRFRPRIFEVERLTLDRLQQILASRSPVIAVLKSPNHVVVVDRMTGTYPNREIHYRDPEPSQDVPLKATETKFAERAIGTYFI
jgi:hypothetical protein